MAEVISRADWGARAPRPRPRIVRPVGTVYIHHAGTPDDIKTDMQDVQAIQRYHMDTKGWADIAYHWLIGRDGKVYEGRGWYVQGAHSAGENDTSYGICFLGNFENENPTGAALLACREVIHYAKQKGHAREIVRIDGHRSAPGAATACPGRNLYAQLPLLRKPLSTPLLGAAQVPYVKAQAWAKAKGADTTFQWLAKLYWEQAGKHGGVRPDLAYAQAAHETGHGRFGGQVSKSQHNPCGMKTTDGKAFATFQYWINGVRAHLDHLALYAGVAGYPRATTDDPRHFAWLKGDATTLEECAIQYAPTAPQKYAETVKGYLTEMGRDE